MLAFWLMHIKCGYMNIAVHTMSMASLKHTHTHTHIHRLTLTHTHSHTHTHAHTHSRAGWGGRHCTSWEYSLLSGWPPPTIVKVTRYAECAVYMSVVRGEWDSLCTVWELVNSLCWHFCFHPKDALKGKSWICAQRILDFCAHNPIILVVFPVFCLSPFIVILPLCVCVCVLS